MKKILSILVLAVLFAVNTQALEMRGDTIYFLFLDRFSDGNPSNNTGNTPQTYSSDIYK